MPYPAVVGFRYRSSHRQPLLEYLDERSWAQVSPLKRSLARGEIPARTLRVLDVGCGSGRPWIWYPYGSVDLPALEIVAFDPEPPDPIVVERLRGKVEFIHRPGVAPKDLCSVPSNSFDVVTSFDCIEHLPKHEGYQLLYECVRISKSWICLNTPNGFVPQPPVDGAPLQAHLSGWEPAEIRRVLGGRSWGSTGPRWLLGPYAMPKWSTGFSLLDAVTLNFFTHLFRKSPKYSFAFTTVAHKSQIAWAH